MPSVRSGAAEVAYDVRGHGPPVLLFHAGVTDSRSWDLLRDHLGDRYRTLAYDRRGFGRTRYEPEPHDGLADALAVLDAEEVDRAVVVGASNGGQRAIDLALAHPERVRALVLIGAGVRGAPDEDPADLPPPAQRLYAAYEAAEEGDDLDELNRVEAHAWLDGWGAEEGRVTGPARDLFLEMNGLALRSADPGPEAEPPPAWHEVHRITVPTLVLCGELDLLALPLSEHLRDQIPGATHEVLRGTAHLPHLEGHRRTLEAISAFLADLP
jgi:pimeloyl-ACP methyl ester carboxylesterase